MSPRNLRIVAVLVAIIVIASALTIVLTRPESEPVLSYALHGAIAIRGNSEFTSGNGIVSGTGSSDHPYIIEGWAIGGPGVSTCIGVFDTTAHFTIRNVHLTHAQSGVYLFNVSSGRVDHSLIENVSTGISVIESASTAVVSNTIKGCILGINILSSNNIRLAYNHFADNIQNVRKPSVPWEQSWIGDAICIAVLIPLLVIVGAALYFRLFRRPGKPQELQVPLEGQEETEAPPQGPPP